MDKRTAHRTIMEREMQVGTDDMQVRNGRAILCTLVFRTLLASSGRGECNRNPWALICREAITTGLISFVRFELNSVTVVGHNAGACKSITLTS